MTTDEELNLLDDQLRRLKIEYDIYFGGGSKRPPADIEWKVKNLLRKLSDGSKLTYSQRFRYNTMQQRHALFNALWQQKLIIKEEGYRRPQDAVMGIQGLRSKEEHEAEAALKHRPYGARPNRPFTVACSDVDREPSKVEALFQALAEARKQVGDTKSATLGSFQKFVRQKTDQIRKQYKCQAVEYSVELQNGQVKLTAKPKT
ncbi:MAG TPA: MXAN_5187 C-terminal domain-containing protein [Candidatus Angelobacter sp.]|nr:MXAN_5187 C-terminal domain-containing protein [Candidatus Angelobacter sp.]